MAGRSTGLDVGKGTMAWELQVVAGTEPVAYRHMQEEVGTRGSQLKECRLYPTGSQ